MRQSCRTFCSLGPSDPSVSVSLAPAVKLLSIPARCTLSRVLAVYRSAHDSTSYSRGVQRRQFVTYHSGLRPTPRCGAVLRCHDDHRQRGHTVVQDSGSTRVRDPRDYKTGAHVWTGCADTSCGPSSALRACGLSLTTPPAYDVAYVHRAVESVPICASQSPFLHSCARESSRVCTLAMAPQLIEYGDLSSQHRRALGIDRRLNLVRAFVSPWYRHGCWIGVYVTSGGPSRALSLATGVHAPDHLQTLNPYDVCALLKRPSRYLRKTATATACLPAEFRDASDSRCRRRRIGKRSLQQRSHIPPFVPDPPFKNTLDLLAYRSPCPY